MYVFKLIFYIQPIQPLLRLVYAQKRHVRHSATICILFFRSGAYNKCNYAAGIHAFACGRLLIGYKLLRHGAAVHFSRKLKQHAVILSKFPRLVKVQPNKVRRAYFGLCVFAEGFTKNSKQRQRKHYGRTYGNYRNGGYLFLHTLIA